MSAHASCFAGQHLDEVDGKAKAHPLHTSDAEYRWGIEAAPLSKVANHEKKMPNGFIRKDGYRISAAARKYLELLIHGEAYRAVWTRWLAELCVAEERGGEEKLATWAG